MYVTISPSHNNDEAEAERIRDSKFPSDEYAKEEYEEDDFNFERDQGAAW